MVSLTDFMKFKEMPPRMKSNWMDWNALDIIESLERLFVLDDNAAMIHSLLTGQRPDKVAMSIEILENA